MRSSKFPLLAGRLSVHDIADRCRDVGLSFVNETRTPWSWKRRDIGTWLLRAHSIATIPSANTAITELLPRVTADALLSDHYDDDDDDDDDDDTAIEILAYSTGQQVIERLAECAQTWRIEGFARDMVEGGLVTGVSDSLGATGYAPVADRTMRLLDRVMSLFVADYLTRPRDYESLVVCEACEAVSFAWAEMHDRECDRVRKVSGISGIVVCADREVSQVPTRRGLGT